MFIDYSNDYSDIWRFMKWLKEINIEIERIFNAIDLKDFKNGIRKNYEIIDIKLKFIDFKFREMIQNIGKY